MTNLSASQDEKSAGRIMIRNVRPDALTKLKRWQIKTNVRLTASVDLPLTNGQGLGNRSPLKIRPGIFKFDFGRLPILRICKCFNLASVESIAF